MVKVWYATNRKPKREFSINDPNPYTDERDEYLNFGMCFVEISKNHKPFTLANNILNIPLLESSTVNVKNVIRLEKEEYFWNSVKGALSTLKSSKERRVLVFIHGYNNSFNDAARRTAQIWADLGISGIPAFFSWPAHSSILKYMADEAAIEASEESLAKFLINLRKHVRAETACVPLVVEKGKGVFSRYPKNNWLMG